MKNPLITPVALVAALLLCSCSGGGPGPISDPTRGIDALDTSLGDADGGSPTVEQYQKVRHEFVAGMLAIQRDQAGKTGSAAHTVKTIIAAAGVGIALGGTAAGLVVEDDDTKTTIAQSSAAFAGVAGLVGLLPFGNVPKGAESIQTYLAIHLPAFEERWPASLAEPLAPEQWDRFVEDADRMDQVLRELSR